MRTPEQKEKKRAYQRAYYQANKEEVAKKGKAWREKNAEKLREYEAARRPLRRDYSNALSKRLYHEKKDDESFKDKRATYRKKFAEKHRDLVKVLYAQKLLALRCGVTFKEVPRDLAEIEAIRIDIARSAKPRRSIQSCRKMA